MKRQPKSEEETLALCVQRQKDSDGKLKVDVRLCTITRRDGCKRQPYSPERAAGMYIRDLGTTCYWSDYGGGHLMLGDIEYTNVHTANEGRLTEMLATIKRVHKAMDKVREMMGHVELCDEYLTQLAVAMGVTVVFVWAGSGEHVAMDVGSARQCIRTWVEDEQNKREDRRRAGIGM